MNTNYLAESARQGRADALISTPDYLIPFAGSGRHVFSKRTQATSKKESDGDGAGQEIVSNKIMDGVADSAFSGLAAAGNPLASILSLVQTIQDSHVGMAVEHLGPSESVMQQRSERLQQIFRNSTRLDPAAAFRAPSPLSSPCSAAGSWAQGSTNDTKKRLGGKKNRTVVGIDYG